MANLKSLDLENVPDQTFEVLPAGDYPVILTEIVEKATKDGTGSRMNCKASVLSGKHQNAVLFGGYNVRNASSLAQLIGRQQFKTIGAALNLVSAELTDEWLNKPLVAVVKVTTDQNGNPRNEIASFKPRLVPAASLKSLVAPKAPAEPAAEPDPSLVEQSFHNGEKTEEAPAKPARKNPYV